MSIAHLTLALACIATAAHATPTTPPAPLLAPEPSGSAIQIAAGATQAAVAFDAGSGLYLITWNAAGSVLAQRTRRDGSGFGAPILVAAGTQPRIASIRSTSAFVLTYAVGTQLRARAIDALSGALSNEVAVMDGAPPIAFAIGGEDSPNGDGALIAYSAQGYGTRISRVEVDNTGALAVASTKIIDNAKSSELTISPRGGANDEFLVIWELGRMNGQVFSGQLAPGTAFDLGSAESGRNRPRTDGDGTTWTVSQQRNSNGPFGTLMLQVLCRTVSVAQRRAVYGTQRTVSQVFDLLPRDLDPAIASLGQSSLTGYLAPAFLGQMDLTISSVDAIRCDPCEGRYNLGTGAASSRGVEIASEGPGGTGALVVWLEGTALMASRFNTADGRVTDLGGGCALSADAVAGCAKTTFGGFRLHLRATPGFSLGAPPSALAYISIGRADEPCAPCTLFPDINRGMVIPVTGTVGQFYSLWIPVGGAAGLRGKAIYAQWLIPGRGCRTLGAAMSNGLEVRLE